MKFLCEQCKAKYQIADDKVAGKTVRMKCRKCGHMIEVRAEVTESSVAKSLPPEDGKKPAKPPTKGLATSLTARPPAAPRAAKPDALAGAFQKRVTAEAAESTASLEILDSSSASGWYVAINGVPVGPIRISELRRKAANGAVNDDSLVWREGLEEWRPVRSVTELAEIVREAMSSGRPSLVTPPPPQADARPSQMPPAPAAQPTAPRAPARPVPRAPEPPRAAPLAARSNVVPFTGRLATAEKVEEDDEEIGIEEAAPSSRPGALAALAAPAAAPAPLPPAPFVERPSLVTADPFALGAPPAMVAASVAAAPAAPLMTPAPPAASIAVSPPVVITEQRRQTNPIVIGMVLAFMGFGVTAAVFIFKKDPQPQQPQVIIVPQPQAQQGVATGAPLATAATTETPAAPATSDKPSTGGGARTVTRPATSVAQTNPKPGGAVPLDPSLLGGPDVRPGGGNGNATAGGSGGHRSEDSIQNTVRNYQLGVRRTCWERSGVQTPSVNVNAKINIGTSGQVSSVEASGNDAVVSKCIEDQVKKWNFGPGDSVTVNIPFKFVRQ